MFVLDRSASGGPVPAGVSARIPLGKCTAVVGTSAAGKTTLLRPLNRLEEPSEGRVSLDGVSLHETWAAFCRSTTARSTTWSRR
nr:hypothetical protein GCM10010200_099040 [Actinomadura rugatobispora]